MKVSEKVSVYCAAFAVRCLEFDYEAMLRPHACDDCNGIVTIRMIAWSEGLQKYVSTNKEKSLIDIERFGGFAHECARIDFDAMNAKLLQIMQPVQSMEKH